jgi:hypothetical protein
MGVIYATLIVEPVEKLATPPDSYQPRSQKLAE